MNAEDLSNKEEIFENLFWEAVKTKVQQNKDISYLDLGGTSLGIFLFTEGIRKKLGLEVPPEALLDEGATLSNLKKTYLRT